MRTWSAQRFKIRTRDGGELEVNGLVKAGANVGIHTDPLSRSLHVTVLSGPHAGHRYGPPFEDLGEVIAFIETHELENEGWNGQGSKTGRSAQ